MTLSKEQLGILQHSIGVDQYGHGESHRNHFVTGESGRDALLCESLCAYGLMKRTYNIHPDLTGGGICYFVTEAGRRLFFSQCPKPPKKTPGQLRYEEWLRLDDCTDETFGEWIKNKGYARAAFSR